VSSNAHFASTRVVFHQFGQRQTGAMDASDARSPRDAAPPYLGEGPPALWHFSEDPGLSRFLPRVGSESPGEPLVWAVDTRHAPLYWFPRECPRGCIWESSSTTRDDRERFFGLSAASRIHVIESSWFDAVRACHLYGYELAPDGFERHGVGGYWTSRSPVVAVGRHEVGELLDRHVAAGFELRVTPSIWPFWKQVAASTLEFSGCRLRNAAPHPDRVE
jgi:hypothetical protein